jgi:hydroxymethylpyrimidine pyrophosphatase-like HAD family hydrolase
MIQQPKTIFCDIDGTLVEHKQDIIKNIFDCPIILPNVIENIKLWDKYNYKIILITGRRESTRKETEKQLSKLGIVYDMLIMGITNGDRIIINDKKLNGIRNTCFAVNLVRNAGLKNIDIIDDIVTISNEHLLVKNETLWGNYELIEYNDKYVVKKKFIKKGFSIDAEYHELKTETIVIVSGKIIISIGNSLDLLEEKEYSIGDTITIKPYTIHIIKCIENCLFIEISTNELWDVKNI